MGWWSTSQSPRTLLLCVWALVHSNEMWGGIPALLEMLLFLFRIYAYALEVLQCQGEMEDFLWGWMVGCYGPNPKHIQKSIAGSKMDT